MGSKKNPPAPPRPPKKRKPLAEALDDIPTVSVDGILPPASVRELDLSDVELVDELDEIDDEFWSTPPTELDEFLDDGGDEAPLPRSEPAPAAPQAGPGPLQEPPAPVDDRDHQDDGPTSEAKSHAGDSEPPSSLRQMFSKVSPDSRPWWSDDDDALAHAPGAIPAPPPLDGGEDAARALLRASGRPAAPAEGDVIEIDLAPPSALPDLAAPDAKKRAGRSATSSVSPSDRSQPSKRQLGEQRPRTAIYAVVIAAVVIGAALWIRQKPAADSTIARDDTTRPDSAPGHQASPGAGGAAAPSSEPTSTLSMGPSSAWILGPGHVPTLNGEDAGAIAQPPDAGGEADTNALGQNGSGSDAAAPTASASAESEAPFDRPAANSALQQAAGIAALCPRVDSAGTRRVTVAVTFAPSGRVTTALVAGGPYAGTPTGSCIARAFRSARVPPFTGSFVTVQKTLQLQ